MNKDDINDFFKLIEDFKFKPSKIIMNKNDYQEILNWQKKKFIVRDEY